MKAPNIKKFISNLIIDKIINNIPIIEIYFVNNLLEFKFSNIK